MELSASPQEPFPVRRADGSGRDGGGSEAPETFVLIRGSARQRPEGGAGVPGGARRFDAGHPGASAGGKTSGRRTVLANWVASPDNPLTSRVMANRLWQYHFGRGIVRSPNNFAFRATPRRTRSCSTGLPASSSRAAGR